MSSLISRLLRRPPAQRLPSYVPSDTTPSRTPFRKLINFAILGGFAYCTGSLTMHYLIRYDGSEGDSMMPTITSANSMSVTSPRYRYGKNIKVGDIVHAKNPVLARGLVGKRVIGMPGDYVVLDASQAPSVGGARVDGIRVGNEDGEREQPMMFQVPEGHVWLAGDNMSRSRDSRFYGAVPLAMIESKVLYNGSGLFEWQSFRKEQIKPASTLEKDKVERGLIVEAGNSVD